jgi:hypothetical protein
LDIAEKKEKPSITDVRLDWGDLADKEQIKNIAVPASIFLSSGVLFMYSVLPKSAIPEGQVQDTSMHASPYPSETERRHAVPRLQDKIKVTLRGKLGDNEVSHELIIDVNAARKDVLVHQLYARSAIRGELHAQTSLPLRWLRLLTLCRVCRRQPWKGESRARTTRR